MTGSLPLDLGPFVGRDELLDTVGRLLQHTRLLTLTGPGGVGKSRLAIRAAAGLDTVHYADLHDRAPAHLWAHLALALGIRHHGAAGPDVVAAHLAAQPGLLILDSCDQLVDQAASAAATLLRAAPGLRILATSRQRLGVDGEHTLTVPPLTGPDSARLFTALAEAAGVSPATPGAVEKLCRHLDGLPLAIKLAAGRARTMSLTELTDGVADRFSLLTGLDRVVDLSYRQCTPAEQQLWNAVAVYSAPFTADAVADRAALDGLVDKSVLTCATDTHPARFAMLDTLREYGLRQLGDQVRQARDRHRDHVRDRLAAAATGWLGPQELRVLATVRDELPDIVTAIDHSLATGAHADARAMARDLVRTRAPFLWGFLDIAATQLERTLAPGPGDDPIGYAATAATAAWIAAARGRRDTSAALLAAARAATGGADIPPILFAAGAAAVLLDGDPTAVELLTAARAALTGPGSGGDRHMAGLMASIAAGFSGHPDAHALAARQMHDAETAGAAWSLSWAIWSAGHTYWLTGDHDTAAGLVRLSLTMQREAGDQWGQIWGIELAALITTAQLPGADDPDEQARRAAWLFGAADALRKRLGIDLSAMRPLAAGRARALDDLQQRLGADTVAGQARAGAQGLDHALRAALGEPVSRRASAPPGGGLTAREREISGLVAQGLTSAQIGARLLISARTVDTHIRNIGAKLGLANRAAIAAWAARR